ncbi:MAG: HAD hydrolase-like protein [Lachnospiraceae bacterium]|nr:HAD hydrolase-like protein [Lachnospiraceae bacterium]
MYRYVIFDLDGTLTDSGGGIVNAVTYAIGKLNIENPGPGQLKSFIGPPLRESFERVFGLVGEENAEAIRLYREYYEEKGIWENAVYPGMEGLLSDLKKEGCVLAVASSKPERFVKMILSKFELDSYFKVVVGALEDGERDTKEEVLEEALKQLRKSEGAACRPSQILMVGDRIMDLSAATGLGIDTAIVTYGFAPEEELKELEPAYFADDMGDLYRIACGKKPYMRFSDKPAIMKTVEILMPLLIYWVIQLGVFNLCYAGIVAAMHPEEPLLSRIRVYLNVVATVATWPYLVRAYKNNCPPEISDVTTHRKKRLFKKDFLLILSSALALGLGLNIIILLPGIAEKSAGFQRVAGNQYSVSLPVGLVIYGILVPFTEEVLFRGILQNRIMRYYPRGLGIFLSALLFGCYHGNPVQIFYAFMMGLSISLVYARYQLLEATALMHCGANLLVYFLSKQAGFSASPVSAAMGAVFVAAGLGLNFYFAKSMQKAELQKKIH